MEFRKSIRRDYIGLASLRTTWCRGDFRRCPIPLRNRMFVWPLPREVRRVELRTVSKELEKPIKVLFVAGNGLIWIVFCLAIAWDWHKMSASSQWAGVLLAVTYLLLGRS